MPAPRELTSIPEKEALLALYSSELRRVSGKNRFAQIDIRVTHNVKAIQAAMDEVIPSEFKQRGPTRPSVGRFTPNFAEFDVTKKGKLHTVAIDFTKEQAAYCERETSDETTGLYYDNVALYSATPLKKNLQPILSELASLLQHTPKNP